MQLRGVCATGILGGFIYFLVILELRETTAPLSSSCVGLGEQLRLLTKLGNLLWKIFCKVWSFAMGKIPQQAGLHSALISCLWSLLTLILILFNLEVL